jgi:hypothetical protein
MNTQHTRVTDTLTPVRLPSVNEAIAATRDAYTALTAPQARLAPAIWALWRAHRAALRAYRLTSPSHHPLDFPSL